MADFEISLKGGLDALVAALPEVHSAAHDGAEKIAGIARNTAPVDSGKYRDSIIVQRTPTGARVFSYDPKSAIIEFGAPRRNQPARFNLRRAADSSGFKFGKP